MSADQIAEMAPFIREVLDAPERNLCATFEVSDNKNIWAQVVLGVINIAYPSEEDPEHRLVEFLADPLCAGVSEWEPLKCVTLLYNVPDRPQIVARFVDRLLADLFKLGDYSVDASLEDL